MLYSKLNSNKVKCNLCNFRCVIADGKRGICGLRENRNGILYTLVYGKVISYAIDPIEKKPLFHFYPGSTTFSIATIGCNFRCIFCDNWTISQDREVKGEELLPEEIVYMAKRYGCKCISYTYTEPTIFFEYAYDIARLAHKEGIFNTFVTNGYMTPEAIDLINGYLDAATVDFKGSGDPDFYKKFCKVPDVEPIFQSLLEMKKKGIFIEITDLIVTGGGDSKEAFKKFIKKIVDILGDSVPLHILRFFPSYMYLDVTSTPIKLLEELYNIAKDYGLKYVYLGNVPGHKYEHTYCPNCNNIVIKRIGFEVIDIKLKGKNCIYCNNEINIRI